ncbi:MAG TPA: hypothetical protein VMJ93_02200 [Verrucomicrobiae bacterium]|nr:hypothetical protein [Verrucomicrobiae bacterium]
MRAVFLATKALGLVSSDTSPFCIATYPVDEVRFSSGSVRGTMRLCPDDSPGRWLVA